MAKIVLVEDDVMLAEIYQTRLQTAGFTCLVANDGLAGLSLIKNEMPDLVLLDLMLPEIAGDEILRHMRKSNWGKEIKVIILTNISEAEANPDLRRLGFERYIVKANLMNNQLVEIVSDTLGIKPKTEAA
jgi:two-component system phosphate regulon response regulator PhoB